MKDRIQPWEITTVYSGLVFPEYTSTILQGFPHLEILHCSVPQPTHGFSAAHPRLCSGKPRTYTGEEKKMSLLQFSYTVAARPFAELLSQRS